MNTVAGYGDVDTIAARATPRGASALSVTRLSGPKAVQIAASVFEGRDLSEQDSHTAHVGFIRDADSTIDQVVVTIFRAPNSSTGQDVVEITCHGGDVTSDALLSLLVQCGARHAEPGEFTLRSFMNGKVDLAQAEAIAELIHARSSRATRISMAHIRGRYSEELSSIRSDLVELLAMIELELDFSEEDVAFADKDRLNQLLSRADERLKILASSFRLGRAVTDGIRVVIYGRPNAGKSTLLNAIVGYDRVIVSDIPGTTRDEVESEIEFEGVRYQFVDTAGLRATDDVIEAEGVRRSLNALEGADLVIEVVDLTTIVSREKSGPQSQVQLDSDLPHLRIGNKVDLVERANVVEEDYDGLMVAETLGNKPEQVELFMKNVARLTVGSDVLAEEHQVVTSARQQAHVRNAANAVSRARQTLDSGGSGDMLSSDVRLIVNEIGSITGEVTNEDILDQIFSRFCIGK